MNDTSMSPREMLEGLSKAPSVSTESQQSNMSPREMLEGLSKAPSVSMETQGTDLPYSWVDGDTVKGDDGTLYRIQGFDAPELGKFLGGKFKPGTQGGTAAAQALKNLANKTGYTNLKVLGEDAAYGRKTAILTNDRGESFTDRIIQEGVLDPTFQTNERTIIEKNAKELFGDLLPQNEDADEFAKAAELIKQGMIQEGYDSSNFKIAALNEAQRVGLIDELPGLISDDVQFRSTDRTIDNESLKPMTNSWDAGVSSVIESAYGFASLVGDSLGIDSLKEFGDAGVYRTRRDMEDTPSLLLDYKDVDGFGEAVEFVGNNLAMSLPYMGMMIASGAAAPLTGGASLAVMPSVYSGQVWNEQPEDSKNAINALGAGVLMATVDRLGLKGAVGGFKGIKAGSMTTKELYNKAVSEQAKSLVAKGVAKDTAEQQAKDMVANASKLEIGQISKEVVDVMSQQLKSKGMVMQLLKRVGTGTAFEGTTEALQETIGYVGANLDGGVIDFTEMGERALGAAIAGGSLGGPLAAGGATIDYAKWADVAWRQTPAMERDKAEAQRYAEEEEAEHGYVRSIQQISKDVRENLQEENKEAYKESMKLFEEAEKMEILWSSNKVTHGEYKKAKQKYEDKMKEINSKYDLNTLYQRHTEKRKAMSTKDKVFDALNRMPELWRNSVSSILPKEMQVKSKTARELADMFGGNRNRVFSGSNFESHKHHIVAKYKTEFGDVNDTWAKLNDGRRPNSKRRAELSKQVYDVLLKASDPKRKGNFNEDLVPDDTPNRQAVVDLGNKMQNLAKVMHEDQLHYNKKLGYVGNYLAKFKVLDKNAIADNPERFTQLLISEYGMSPSDANKTTDAIINNNEVSTIEEALESEQDGEFNSVRGGFKPSSHNKRTLALSENEKFQDFMEQDIFSNISYAAKAAARYQANQEFVGFNGSVIGKKLDDAVKNNEMTQEEADRIAYGLRNYLDAESGNYKRPTTEFGKKLQNIQRNLIFFTTIAGLPLATISSIVELALTMNALSKDQIFGKDGRKGGLKQMGKELADMLWQGSQETFSTVTTIDVTKRRSASQKRLRDLGFYDWDVGAATKTGVTETSALKQKFIQGFFKANGLQGFTQMTRAVRLSIAGDYIFDHLDNILNSDLDSPTKGSLESIKQLRDLGVDMTPSKLNTLHYVMNKERSGLELNGTEAQLKDDFLREAEYNFVNQAIMLPGAANRPLWLQDPRFGMFNQFQGFISTFTSTFLPRLWGDYVKRGSPAMKYNAFGTMATMILLGFVSQEFKDRLKYGESTPYLDEAEWIRRGVSSSGLLGSSERVINTLFPMYETRSDGVFEWAWNEASGQAPSVSMLTSAAGSIADLIEGDTQKATDKFLRITPVGPITWFRKDLAELVGGN